MLEVGDLVRYADAWSEAIGIVVEHHHSGSDTRWLIRWLSSSDNDHSDGVWLSQDWFNRHCDKLEVLCK